MAARASSLKLSSASGTGLRRRGLRCSWTGIFRPARCSTWAARSSRSSDVRADRGPLRRGNVPADFAWLEGQEVTVSLNRPPGREILTVNGTSLVLTYPEDLDSTSVPDPGAYAVTVDGGTPAAPSGVAVSGRTVTLTLAEAVSLEQVVTLSYTVPASNPVQDESGLKANRVREQGGGKRVPRHDRARTGFGDGGRHVADAHVRRGTGGGGEPRQRRVHGEEDPGVGHRGDGGADRRARGQRRDRDADAGHGGAVPPTRT